MIELSLLLIPEEPSPRRQEVEVPDPENKSLTDKLNMIVNCVFLSYSYLGRKEWFLWGKRDKRVSHTVLYIF